MSSKTTRAPVPDEVDRFIKDNIRTFMLTLRRDGSPTGHPMGGFYGDGLFLNMYHDSVKARNLFRDPAICCVVTTLSDSPDFEGVMWRGNARYMPPEKVFEEAAPRGALKAGDPRQMSEERSARDAPSADNPDDPVEAEKRLSAVRARVMAGIRIVFDIVPEEVCFLRQNRR